jgi:RHS repeat-associated protein
VTTASGTRAVTFGAGGAVQLVTDDSGQPGAVLSLEIGLPGGARATIPAGGTATIAHTAITGEALATTAAPALGAGGTFAPGEEPGLADRVGPYGERLGEADLDPDSASPDYLWHAATRADTLPGSTGITVVGARAYLPATGEFLTADPLVDSGQNLYGYTDGDPINAKDTSGNESETDWTWVWVAVGAAALSIALGVGNHFIKPGRTFDWRRVYASSDAESPSRWSVARELLRSSPAKRVVLAGVVVSSVTAGVATGMALRNQVSDTWQAVAIGIGAAVATLGVTAGASWGVAAILQKRATRRALLTAPVQPPPPRTSSVVSYEASEETMSARGSGHTYRNPLLDVGPSSRLSGNAGGVEDVARLSGNL